MRTFFKASVIVFGFLILFQTALAVNVFFTNQYFGGTITKVKALELETLEAEGYSCPGSDLTIEIKPIKGPESYFAPPSVNKTKTTISSGQKIIGKYGGTSTIECIKTNEDGSESVKEVTLPKIIIFGTSKR